MLGVFQVVTILIQNLDTNKALSGKAFFCKKVVKTSARWKIGLGMDIPIFYPPWL